MKDPKALLASDATPWEARLLRAARDEEPGAEARAALQRKLGLEGSVEPALRPASPPTPPTQGLQAAASKLAAKWLVLAGAGAALLGALPLVLRATSTPPEASHTAHSTPEPTTRGEPTRPSAQQHVGPPQIASTRGSDTVGVEGPAHQSVSAGGSSAGAQGTSATLAAELASLERARAALRDEAPGRALSQLAAYEGRYPHGALREEAGALHWEALLAHGDLAQAARAARAFLRRYPKSVHAVRIRAQLARSDDAR